MTKFEVDTVSRRSWYALWAVFLLLLMWPAILNKGVFLFPDTSTYIRSADGAVVRLSGYTTHWSEALYRKYPQAVSNSSNENEKPSPVASAGADQNVLAGRSIYYGAALYVADYLGSFWIMAIAQAALVATASLLMARRLAGLDAGPNDLLPILLVPILTSAGFYTAFMMPDLLASLALAATAMIGLFWQGMPRKERTFWLAVLILALVSHSANILIVAIVSGCIIVFGRLGKRRLVQMPVLGALALAIISEVAFNEAIRFETGQPPVRPPFLIARLIDDGPGYSYLRDRCPTRPDLVLCRYLDRLPQPSDTFLWAEGNNGVFSVISPAEQRLLSSQENEFVLGVIRDHPVAVVKNSIGRFFNQLSSTGMMEFDGQLFDPQKLPVQIRSEYLQTGAAQNRIPVEFFSTTALLGVLLSGIGLVWIFWAHRKDSHRFRDQSILFGIVLLGILTNALVCGAISTPHDRYQTRLLWLVPLIFLSIVKSLVLLPPFMRAQNDPDKSQHKGKGEPGPNLIAFIAKVIRDSTTHRRSKILPKTVPGLSL